ncbi:MAG: hypothetical protein ABIM50_10945 [Novosphingobium sp.]
MSIRRYWPAGLAAVALAAFPFVARAQAGSPATPQVAASSVAGWGEFAESVRTLPDRMLAKLPIAMRGDPQVQQEIARLALEALTTSTLETIGGDGDAPVFLPSIGQLLNVGQPNADTIYRAASITPGGSYRIRGRRGSLRLTVLAQVVPQGSAGAGSRAHLHLSDLKADAEGRYDVLLSATRPAGYTGDWWQLDPRATRLMLRMVSADWGKEAEPTFAIERTDKPVSRPRVPATTLEQRLGALPRAVDYIGLMFVDHVEQLRSQGFVNKLKVFDVPFGALAGQFYYEGVYDLKEDEALIIESPVPAKCDYRSLILTNEIYETTDWINNHASLNDTQAKPDSDGKLRIVVSAKDPGVANWMDTSGYPVGVIQGRWTGCDSQPIPDVHKVKVRDVPGLLPRDTPRVSAEQRQTTIRERRRALMERPYW